MFIFTITSTTLEYIKLTDALSVRAPCGLVFGQCLIELIIVVNSDTLLMS